METTAQMKKPVRIDIYFGTKSDMLVELGIGIVDESRKLRHTESSDIIPSWN